MRENLRYFARILGVSAERIEAVVATVDLHDAADRLFSRRRC